MTPQEHARAAAQSAPTPEQIEKVTAALFAAPPHCYASGVYRGWTFAVHDSPFTHGALLITAIHPTETGKSEEVATQDEARSWLRRVAT